MYTLIQNTFLSSFCHLCYSSF